MAATYPRGAHPAARPKPMALDRLVRIGRATREITALASDERRKRQLIDADERVREAARREPQGVHGAGAASASGSSAPVLAAACLAAIWPSASTTASKVSNVEAWRAL